VDRPYVMLSCAMSIDGYIDDASDRRLVLSGEADLDRVDDVRAGCDAILVGAGTIRADDPALLVRSPARREARVARGLPPDPVKVMLTASAELDPAARFFTTGESARLVYTTSGGTARARERLRGAAEVIDAGDRDVSLSRVLLDLAGRGIRRLLVEGGTAVHTQFLTTGLTDELQLVVAPVFVGDSQAPRFAGDGRYPWHPEHPARLVEVRQVGDDVLLTYALSDRYGLA
jgi:5-amino-6-(5-phosphoribosylamino)uracil reductase